MYTSDPAEKLPEFHGRTESVRGEIAEGANQVVGLGQDFVFEIGMVAAERIHRADAADGSVKIGEQFVGDARGYFGAVAPAERVFMGDEDAAGFAHACGDGFPIVGLE